MQPSPKLTAPDVFARNVRAERARQNRIAADVAQVAGITPATLSAIENGRTAGLGIDTAEAVARALGIPLSKLLEGV